MGTGRGRSRDGSGGQLNLREVSQVGRGVAPAAEDVPAVRTGATYEFEGYTVKDPAGGSWPGRMRGRALLDGGTFGGWWSTTECGGKAGVLYIDFDLHGTYVIAGVEVDIREPVDGVTVAAGPDPRPEDARELRAATGRHHEIDGLDAEARYVRLAIRKRRGPLHVSEVSILTPRHAGRRGPQTSRRSRRPR